MFGMDFDRAAKLAAVYISQDASEKCAKDLLTQIGYYGDVDFVNMREDGKLYAVRPEFFEEADFEQLRFNPKETYFAYDTLAEPVDVKPNTDKEFAALNMFYRISFVVDGETVYSESFATSDDPDSECVQLKGIVVPADGSFPYKRLTDISEIAKKLNHLLDLYAPYGVQERSVVEFELDRFRKQMLRKIPMKLEQDKFDDLIMKTIQDYVLPLYRKAVSFRMTGSNLYIQIPERGESSLLGTRNSLPECSELCRAFCRGTLSLSELTDFLITVINQRLSKWGMLQAITVWDEVKDLISLEKMDINEAIHQDICLRNADEHDFLPVVHRNDGLYVYRIYPFIESDALKDRSFLVTGNLIKQWNHRLSDTEKITYLDLADSGLCGSAADSETCILIFSSRDDVQEAAG